MQMPLLRKLKNLVAYVNKSLTNINPIPLKDWIMLSVLKLAPLFVGAYLVRLLVTGASVGDSITLAALSALYAYFLFLESKKEIPLNKEHIDRIVELEERSKVHQDAINAFKIVGAFNGRK